MRRSSGSRRGWTARSAALLCLLAAIAAAPLWRAAPGAGQVDGAPAPVAQPVLGLPGGSGKVFVGASPGEAAGEVWALSGAGDVTVFRSTDTGGWETMPPPTGVDGAPLEGARVATSHLAGRATLAGGVAFAARRGSGTRLEQYVVVRDPGGRFEQAPAPSSGGSVLEVDETLFRTGSVGGDQVLLAAVDESSGHTGAFVVPFPSLASQAPQRAVIHFDGEGWTRESICLGATASPCNAPGPGFAVLAIDASDPSHAWLLADAGTTTDGVVLLSRDDSGPAPIWRQRELGGPLGELFGRGSSTIGGATARVEPRRAGQPLTVADGGVWVDAELQTSSGAVDATMFYAADDGRSDPEEMPRGVVVESWCDAPAALIAFCARPLGAELPDGAGRSYAWEGLDGQRVITGVGQGALLSLRDRSFSYVPTLGGTVGADAGAAFTAPDEGWLGADPPVHYTRGPAPNRLQPWPVPFRRPLLAVAPEPGKPVAALGSRALAVGDRGQVARYVPGEGWTPEPLLTASGARATPRLRGVAWPEPGRAHAVGDDAEMWLWRGQTGLWEPDPAKPPNLAYAHFTGVAFDPANPQRGYAVGKHGLLLRYDREWTQEQLPAGFERAHFSSIAFAGGQALVGYRFPALGSDGGLLVNDGTGWRRDESVPPMAIRNVAGLPDGGAAIASGGTVLVREDAGAAWRPLPPTSYPVVALAAIRERGRVRAVVSVKPGGGGGIGPDNEEIFGQPPPGQAPLVSAPDPPPVAGHLLRDTDVGWRDEQHQAFPTPVRINGRSSDWPFRPDVAIALLLDASGTSGWVVGGETGEFATLPQNGEAVQTASVARYPADGPSPAMSTSAPLASDARKATFAIGGNAQCATACADFANVDIGPDASLTNAVGRAAAIPGVRAFLHTGPGLGTGGRGLDGQVMSLGSALSAREFARESARYAQRLAAAAGPLPVFAAPADSDLDGGGTLATFTEAFAAYGAPLGTGSPGRGIAPVSPAGGTVGYYSFDSSGEGGTVRVIVLDYSAPAIGDAQRCWLARELSDARADQTPAVVVGYRDLAPGRGSPNVAADASDVVKTVVTGTPTSVGCTLPGPPGGASAYFFDRPEQNRAYPLSSGGRSIPSFGSGTLGYVTAPGPLRTDFVGASGFLLAEVDVARRDAATNVAPVTARLIPSIAELAMDATDGTLLRRSQPALFQALARRPQSGMRVGPPSEISLDPDPYVPIPTLCRGTPCGSALFPEYRFTSSDPDIADFVRADPASPDPRSVLLAANDKPMLDSSSGLVCAFNAGTTTLTVTAGGLSYSQKVTVQKGSVQRPCGTTPLRNPPRRPGEDPQVPSPPPSQPAEPALKGGATPLPPPPAPAAAPVPPPTPSPVPIPYLFIPPIAGVTQVPVAVPPPAPSAARPSPPSGTSSAQVYQNAVAPQRQREVEEAIDLVHHMSASGVGERAPLVPAYVPALVLMLAFAGSGIRRSRRARRGRELAYANSSRPPRRPRRSRR